MFIPQYAGGRPYRRHRNRSPRRSKQGAVPSTGSLPCGGSAALPPAPDSPTSTLQAPAGPRQAGGCPIAALPCDTAFTQAYSSR